jgi:hypothetical protein
MPGQIIPRGDRAWLVYAAEAIRTAPKNRAHVDSLMRAWDIGEQARWFQARVRGVLNQLSGEALLLLRDPRLEVMVRAELAGGAFAFFPIYSRRRVARLLQPKAGTRVLLVLNQHRRQNAHFEMPARAELSPWARADLAKLSPRARARRLEFERAGREYQDFRLRSARGRAEVFEDDFRHHLGHVLLYLHSPKSRNSCKAAHRVWEDAIIARLLAGDEE